MLAELELQSTRGALTSRDSRHLRLAMGRPDDYVVRLHYCDSQGKLTVRTISPIRFLSPDRVLALCLCRQEPRQFHLNRCSNIELLPSQDVLMPVEILEVAS